MDKRVLIEYRAVADEVRSLWKERTELLLMRDEIISAGGGRRAGGVVARIDELNELLMTKAEYLVRWQQTIEQGLNALSDARERQVIRLRYIEGLDWQEVMARMYYSKERLFQLHRQALRHLVGK